MLTWLFEEGSFASAAKLTAQGAYSVVVDHLGTPLALYDGQGQATWQAQLDSYGQVRQGRGKAQDCPFRYQGQYEDTETGLYYNRFRYYDPETGQYISQDPIRLSGGYALYSYVYNPTISFDSLGLNCQKITNEFPSEEMPTNGRTVAHEVIDGKIKGVNGRRQFDFVVDQNGKLVLGDKHHFLGNGQDVQAAGQLRLNGQGQVRSIDNNSGHYRPSVEEATNFPEILQNAGLDVKGATMRIDSYEIDADGWITKATTVSTKVIK